MAEQKQLRGGTTAQHATFTGAEREVTVDTTKKTVVVHDGSTAGGIPLAKESALTAATANVPLTGYTIAEAAALPSSTDTINVAIGKLAKTASGHTSELSDITTHVNVKSFGATGDGTTDDISAIEDAIEYGLSNNIRNIYFPAGIYRVTRPINLNTYTSGETTIEHHYVRLFSEKAPHFNTADYNATILCDTGAGYAGIEAIDSVGITTENILLLLGTSTIGLLGGRGDEFKNATMQRYKTLFIYGASDHTKNNGLGTIGQICLEAEESSWESCNIYADLALVFARSGTIEKSTVGTDGLPNGTATFTFSSYYGVALVSNYSNYTYHFYGSNRFQSWAAYNPCILFAGDINDIDLGNAFFQL
jgi:hypothetical protein